MAVSKTQIVNLALIELGQSPLNHIDDEKPSALIMRTVYDLVRDQVLRDYPWRFARKRANVASTGDNPAWSHDRGFNNELEEVHSLPSDCLKCISLNGADIHTDLWRVEGRTIVTSMAAPLELQYTRKVTEESEFDSSFVTAFALALAVKTCVRITEDKYKKEQLKEEYQRCLSDARSADGQEGTPRQVTTTGWERARWSGGGSYNWPEWWKSS